MIKKLERHIRVEKGLTQNIKISCPPEQSEIVSKINELVDAVNGILAAQEQYATIYNEDIVPMLTPENKEPADPYAEQCKWIGKLCRFWDDNYKIIKHFGILTRIDETAIVPYEAENGFWYCACEPVKSTDSIIYKGGDNDNT